MSGFLQLILLHLLLVAVLELRLQERRPKAGGQAVRQGDVVSPQDNLESLL
jgi:hypothetical protein